MCIYGDPAYHLRVQLQAPFRNVILTPQMQAFNSSMSSVRSCVEWLFGDIVVTFHYRMAIGNTLKAWINTTLINYTRLYNMADLFLRYP